VPYLPTIPDKPKVVTIVVNAPFGDTIPRPENTYNNIAIR